MQFMRPASQGKVENVTDSGRRPSQGKTLEFGPGARFVEIAGERTGIGDLSLQPVTYITTDPSSASLC